MIWSGFILGFLGSFHCVGMCGPIAFMLPVSHDQPKRKALQVSFYHIGRLIAYSLIGMLFGILGRSFDIFGLQQHLSIAVGIIMIVLVVATYSSGMNFTLLKPLFGLVSKLKSGMGATFKKKSLDAFITMGFLNGLLPCGLVYMALFGALGTAGAFDGAAYMLFFGLGTVPLMTATVYLKGFLSTSIKSWMRKAVPVLVICIGILFIVRGLGLGIPYVSPEQVITVNGSQIECHN